MEHASLNWDFLISKEMDNCGRIARSFLDLD